MKVNLNTSNQSFKGIFLNLGNEWETISHEEKTGKDYFNAVHPLVYTEKTSALDAKKINFSISADKINLRFKEEDAFMVQAKLQDALITLTKEHSEKFKQIMNMPKGIKKTQEYIAELLKGKIEFKNINNIKIKL